MNELHALAGTEAPRNWKAVYTVVDRAGTEKKFWIRVGTAFVNRDESLTVKLDSLPVNGQLQIRDADPAWRKDAPSSFRGEP
jgi:hypothetical protein